MKPRILTSMLTDFAQSDKKRNLIKLSKKVPVICASFEPWRAYSSDQYEIMISDFLLDMEGSIYKHYYTYRDSNYTIEQALQDAYDALVTCLEIDSKPVSLVSNKGAKCPHCKDSGVDTVIPGTMTSDAKEIRDTDGRITSDYSSDVPKRTFAGTCHVCGESWAKTLIKAQFASLFFKQVRGYIQRTIRHTANKLPSWNSLKESSGSLNEPTIAADLTTSDESDDDSKFIASLANRINEFIANKMTARHAQAVRLHIDGRMSNGELLQQSDIAKKMDISKQRVCSIINDEFDRIRKLFTEEEMMMFAKIMQNR